MSDGLSVIARRDRLYAIERDGGWDFTESKAAADDTRRAGRIVVEYLPADEHAGAVALADAAEKFLAEMDALENPRPASSWFALKDAIRSFRTVRGRSDA